MGELRKYTVKQNGYETVMKLDEADAKRLGGTAVDGGDATSSAVEPDADADATPDASADASADAASKAAKAPANKARAGQNKAAE